MRRLLLLVLLAALPARVVAQSSQFGVRGLGLPGRGLSVRAVGTGGSFGLFDPESSLNPAALGAVQAPTAGFSGIQGFRSVDNPAGSESIRETRFPLVTFTGPVKTLPLVFGLSYSSYTDRDFTLASGDTLDLRGVPVPVFDTLSSRGGISDLRLAAAYRLGLTTIGGSFHVLTGSNRLKSRRSFSDSSYVPVAQQAELSYAGVGGELGVVQQVGKSLWAAAMVRSDGRARIERDSSGVFSRVDLPYTLGAGLRWKATPHLDLATEGVYRTWSGANSDLLASGAPGSDNTIEVAVGGEYVRDLRHPYQRPLRFGARYGTLPFLVRPGLQPTELAFSVGTGTRFAQDRAGIDLALEYTRRSAAEFKERSFLLSIGVAVRP